MLSQRHLRRKKDTPENMSLDSSKTVSFLFKIFYYIHVAERGGHRGSLSLLGLRNQGQMANEVPGMTQSKCCQLSQHHAVPVAPPGIPSSTPILNLSLPGAGLLHLTATPSPNPHITSMLTSRGLLAPLLLSPLMVWFSMLAVFSLDSFLCCFLPYIYDKSLSIL